MDCLLELTRGRRGSGTDCPLELTRGPWPPGRHESGGKVVNTNPAVPRIVMPEIEVGPGDGWLNHCKNLVFLSLRNIWNSVVGER